MEGTLLGGFCEVSPLNPIAPSRPGEVGQVVAPVAQGDIEGHPEGCQH